MPFFCPFIANVDLKIKKNGFMSLSDGLCLAQSFKCQLAVVKAGWEKESWSQFVVPLYVITALICWE